MHTARTQRGASASGALKGTSGSPHFHLALSISTCTRPHCVALFYLSGSPVRYNTCLFIGVARPWLPCPGIEKVNTALYPPTLGGGPAPLAAAQAALAAIERRVALPHVRGRPMHPAAGPCLNAPARPAAQASHSCKASAGCCNGHHPYAMDHLWVQLTAGCNE